MRRALLVLVLVACASPSVREEQSLRAYLRAPAAGESARLRDLEAALRHDPVAPGLRLAFVHHALRLGAACDADGLLAAEAGDHPGAAPFLAAYRRLMRLPARPAATGGSALLVVLADHTQQRDVAGDFPATAVRPLQTTGWYVVPPEITADLLDAMGDTVAGVAQGLPDPEALRALRAHGLAGCLLLEVRDFWLHQAAVVESARYDLDYLLWSTRTGEVQWRRPFAGSYERREPLTPFADDDATFFYPSSLGAAFGDAADFVRALNRRVLHGVPPPTAGSE